MVLFWFVFGGLVGFWIGRIWSIKKFLRLKNEGRFNSKTVLDKIRKESKGALKERTEERKNKILEIMKDLEREEAVAEKCDPKRAKKGIDREDVERWLGVSKNTALKYINELEAEGRIEQVGKTGWEVYYRFKK